MKHPLRNSQATMGRPQSHNSQGFTLIELLAVIGILSLLTGLLTLIIFQFLNVPRWGNAQLAIDHDLRNAGLWLMQDGNESASFTAGTCSFDTNRISYALSGTDLQRTDNGSGQTNTVAHYVTNLTCANPSADLAVITLAVSKESVSASQIYTVTMRVD